MKLRKVALGSLTLAAWAVLVPLVLPAQDVPTTRPAEGIRTNNPTVQALVDARVVVGPGRVFDKATVVIRDGVVVAAGPNVVAPPEARVWNLAGKTVYPGLIDAFGEQSAPEEAGRAGAPYWNAQVASQVQMADHYRADGGVNEKLRRQGIGARLVAPSAGVIKGTSVLVATGDDDNSQALLQTDVAQHFRLTLSRGNRSQFPNSPMGAVALARQTLYDAQWYRDAWQAYRSQPTLSPPERNDGLETLRSTISGEQLVIADASDEQFVLRADKFAREFNLKLAIRGSGREYRRIDAIRELNRTLIIPVDFPKPPNVVSADSALNSAFEDLMHWDHAPENAARLEQAGVKFALTSYGLREPAEFLNAVRKAVERGLSPDTALRALTTVPAELYRVQDRLGTVDAGKLANLIVTDGDLFKKGTKIHATWVLGRVYEWIKPPVADVAGNWNAQLSGTPGKVPAFQIELRRNDNGEYQGEIVLPLPPAPPAPPAAKDAAPAPEKPAEAKPAEAKPAEEKKPTPEKLGFAHLTVRDLRWNAVFDSDKLGVAGKSHLSIVVTLGADGKSTMTGELLWADGKRAVLAAQRVVATDKPAGEKSDKPDAKPDDKVKEKEKEKGADKPEAKASFAVTYPLSAFGRSAPPAQATVIFQHATIWTCGIAGLLEDASLIVKDGKIVAVGRDLAVPPGAVVIDARGKHLSPGIIDCHSHMATDGGINESSQSVTAEVRIGDFIDATDINIYRQLAGGVTAAHVLHGSANAIGGQCQLIKLRWGASPEEMKFTEAPATIKFALGENVKQSNWGAQSTGRYPQTRMGVEQLFQDEFATARAYAESWQKWERERTGLPPRRDLELDAIVEIIQKRRWIHCHSYRQDEILAFLRAMELHGVQVRTLQHILEGYKVANEMARHGATGSSFSDWWGYKFEVLDAIPFNGALMHRAGVVVSFNSDDRELARHLNHEAAKAVKYGGVPPVEALKFVTLNPAKQLMVDQYVGSLEAGKQADFAMWSGPPMSTLSRCEQTWVDGRKYFDREEDKKLREEISSRRAALVQKILKSGEGMREPGDNYVVDREEWTRDDEFCIHHNHPLR